MSWTLRVDGLFLPDDFRKPSRVRNFTHSGRGARTVRRTHLPGERGEPSGGGPVQPLSAEAVFQDDAGLHVTAVMRPDCDVPGCPWMFGFNIFQPLFSASAPRVLRGLKGRFWTWTDGFGTFRTSNMDEERMPVRRVSDGPGLASASKVAPAHASGFH